ncbi:MAG: hypothetical protein GZ086_00850 [Gelidibacter sp.]|nr:hypothetical protein [Gelidibacter sp.]
MNKVSSIICNIYSKDGRHLVMMPHIERSIFQWNWAYYPKDRNDEVPLGQKLL